MERLFASGVGRVVGGRMVVGVELVRILVRVWVLVLSLVLVGVLVLVLILGLVVRVGVLVLDLVLVVGVAAGCRRLAGIRGGKKFPMLQ